MTDLTPPDPTEPAPTEQAPRSPDPRTEGATAPPPAHGAAPTRPPRKGAVTAITVTAVIIGSLAVAAAGGGAALAATRQATSANDSSATENSADASGVSTLDLQADAGSVTVRFGDVTQATLHSEGQGSTGWRLQRDGGTLVVRSPQRVLGWWPDAWFVDGPQTILTLPEELEGSLDAELTLDAGALDVQGGFRSLSATVSAGVMTVDGSARELHAEVDAGTAHLRVGDVTTAELRMSAGQLDATLTGSQPDSVSLDVSAGAMQVTVPSGSYALSRNVSAGNLDAGIPTDPSSRNRIQVDLSAGGITLRTGG